MIENNKNFDDNSIIPFFIEPQNDPGRGKVHFCCNSILNLFEEGFNPCKQEFPEVRKKQILDHYFKGICNITSYYGIIITENVSPKPNHTTHQIQTDDIDT